MPQPRSRPDRARPLPDRPEQPELGVVNEDDSHVFPDAWFAYVMPTQIGVEMIGAGRYGYWEHKPEVRIASGDCIVITGYEDTDDREPVLVLPSTAVISVFVAQAKHVDAMPAPIVEMG